MNTCVASFWVMDVGNTRTKWALWQDNALIETGFCLTQALLTPHDVASLLPIPPGETVVLSSVVPQATDCLLAAFQAHEIACVLVDLAMIQQTMGHVVDLSPYAPTLGLDRALNLLGAAVLYPHHRLLVCDFGTTVTLDLLSQDGVFLGGAIAPGIRLFQKTLNPQNAAQLYEVDILMSPQQTPGVDTPQSLANGLHWGYQGMITGILSALCPKAREGLGPTPVLLTGGDAASVVAAFASIWPPESVINPELTLFALSALGHAYWGEKEGLS